MSQSSSDPKDTSPSAPQNTEYPPQLHAGAVGLGPEFGKGVPISQKIGGLKQEIKGKIEHDPELVKQGRDQRTGELKRRGMNQDLAPVSQPGEAHPDEEKHQQEYANQERPAMKIIDHPDDKQ